MMVTPDGTLAGGGARRWPEIERLEVFAIGPLTQMASGW
jgi:hypothetical protein